jgi:hypothetical protein
MGRFIAVFPVVLSALWSLSCGSSTQTVTGPSTSKCPVTAAAQPSTFASAGGTGTVSVNTNRECQWNVSASGGWIQLAAQAAGQGEGSVAFNVSANVEPSQRRGSIVVGEQQLAITQEAAACAFTVSPTSVSMSPGGERRSVTVTAGNAQCAWTARSQTEWLAIVDGAQGTGSGEVVFEARATTGPSRTGVLTVAGQTVTVTQGVGCSTTIAPVSQTVGASGGSGTITVNTASGCTWSAQSDAPWISITSGQSGVGSGTVAFSVSSWNGPSRTGTLRVDGHLFTVTQSAGCSYSLDRNSQSIGSGGGNGSVSVRSASGCAWTASSNVPWITVTSGANGTGDGTAQFSVAANTGPARSGTLVVGGHAFTVNQGGGCSYSINPASQSLGAEGGTGSFTITTGALCEWTATASESWVRITAPANGAGTGSGTIAFSVERSAVAARTATITAGGRTFTVQQGGGCSFNIDPAGQNFSSGGGDGSFNVSAGAGCAWTATASESWVRITSGASGAGNGTVQFNVDPNGGSARAASIAVGGRSFSVQQSAGCTYNLSAGASNFGADGGTGSVTVSTGGGCTWNASAPASDSWVRITSGAGGQGDGAVQFAVDPNPGTTPRSTTLTVAGQPHTINQAGAAPVCTYAVDPAALLVDAAGGSGTFTVNTAAGCSWTATPNAVWLQVTGGASGSGPGPVSFAASPNSGPARTGTISAGGQTFTASQGSGCTVGISPSSQNVEIAGGNGTIAVSTEAGCDWSAAVTQGADWISITAGASGNGAGAVQFAVTANAGAARSGTITVSGQTFTIAQAGI